MTGRLDPWARWESPRALAIVVTTTAALFGALGIWVGYDVGSAPVTPAQVVFETGAVVLSGLVPDRTP